MTIDNLSKTSFDDLLDCFLVAFENYYVKMPTDRDSYKQRWKAAKVDFNFSYGMFDEGKLVGFIIHAVDRRGGELTAFNTGTGVLPEYRGKRIVKSIYDYALTDLVQNGFTRGVLEVITKNDIAIRSYESVGFTICKNYKCYAGDIQIESSDDFEIEEIELEKVDWSILPNQQSYSWDFQKETVLEGKSTFYQILHNEKPESYFIMSPGNKYVAQLDLLNKENSGWNRLFAAMKQISPSVRVINVDDRLKDKIDFLCEVGLENTVDQYEMELIIKDVTSKK